MGETTAIDPQEEWKLLVGGEWTPASGTYEIVDPNTTAVVGHAPDGSVADAEAAIAAAARVVGGALSLGRALESAPLRLEDKNTQRHPESRRF